MNEFLYEVETRVFFKSTDEAYSLLPFLKECLSTEVKWEARMHGIQLFKNGELLRVAYINRKNLKKVFWGYKGKDIGEFCNIRSEKIEDITDGIHDSLVLKRISDEEILIDPSNVKNVLESLGYIQFMSFEGVDLTGKNKELDLSFKLMSCSALKYPVLLEIEKTTITIDDSYSAETKIQDFIYHNNLLDRTIRKEPPTLLYEKLFRDDVR
jgi:hypothetical protein